jgi:hypothetical protein
MVRATSERHREKSARVRSSRASRARLNQQVIEVLEARTVLSLAFNFTISDPNHLLDQFPLLANNLQVAGQTLGRRLNGALPVTVAVSVGTTAANGYIAAAGPSEFFTVPNTNLIEAKAEVKEAINSDPDPTKAVINMLLDPTVIANLGWFDPSGNNRDVPIPQNKFDFVSVAMHELGHGLGLLSTANRDTNGNITGGFVDLYDNATVAANGYAYFVGARAEAAYHGGPVPLYNDHTTAQGSNFSHPGNPSPGPGSDLVYDMMYFQAQNGLRRNISAIDIGILADIGWSVNFTKAADDFSGAGHSDVAVFIPSSAIWAIAPNAGPNQINGNQGPGTWLVPFGPANSIPVPADYTGAGHSDVAVFIPSSAIWAIAPNAGPGQINSNQGPGTWLVQFGPANSIPVPGDYTGAGHADVAVYVPSTGTWYIDPEAGAGQINGNQGSNTYSVQWGQPGDIPVPGDYDGTGRTEIAVFRPSTATWYILPNAGPGQPFNGAGIGAYAVAFGPANATPTPGDYNGTGHTGLGVFIPATATWAITPNEGNGQINGNQGPGTWFVAFGPANSTPVEGGVPGGAPTGGFAPSAVRIGSVTPGGPRPMVVGTDVVRVRAAAGILVAIPTPSPLAMTMASPTRGHAISS